MKIYYLILYILLFLLLTISCKSVEVKCLTGFHSDEGVCISDRFLVGGHMNSLDDDTLAARLILTVPASISIGENQSIQAWLHRNQQTNAEEVTSAVEFISFNPDIVNVEENSQLLAKRAGLTYIRARLNNIWSELYRVQVVDHTTIEARGLWVNRWAYRTASDVKRIMDKAESSGFNQVYFQVRGVFDAYYNSSLEPWAKRLSGKLGQDPGWDPLQVAVDEAHLRGLELHAWINVFTIWEGKRHPSSSGISHKLSDNHKWLARNQHKQSTTPFDSYQWASPAVIEVRHHNSAVVLDIINKYDVDGIHLDRVRYPSADYGYETASIDKFEAEKITRPGLDFDEWRRQQVSNQVADIYRVINDNKPEVVLSAAVSGIYKDEWQWSSVTEGYKHWLQDWQSWAEMEIIDVLIPMVYWSSKPKEGEATDFETLATHNSSMIKNRFVYIGSDLLAVQDAESKAVGLPRQRESFREMQTQILHTRETDARGWVLYDYATLERANYWEQLAKGPFRFPAKAPYMWWKENKTQPPALGRMVQTSSSSLNGVFQPLR